MSALDPNRNVIVELICTRGENRSWHPLQEGWSVPLPAAERLIEYHKRIDLIPPVGHYRYRIVELNGDVLK